MDRQGGVSRGDDTRDDDEYVYSVPGELQPVLSDAYESSLLAGSTESEKKVESMKAAQPIAIRYQASTGKTKPLRFECLVAGAYTRALVDSGASASFVSAAFCRRNNITVRREATKGTLADGSIFEVPGKLHRVHFKLGALRIKHDFYVAELTDVECVLGMDFMTQYEPKIEWRKRCMTVPAGNQPGRASAAAVCLNAWTDSAPALPGDTQDVVELRTIQDVEHTLQEYDAEDLCLCYITPEGAVSAAPADENKNVQDILREFSDVLRSELPPGPPPERLDAEGNPIEHTIETDPNAPPVRSKPFQMSVDEDAEVRKHVQALLDAQFVRPSLSAFASPVLLVRKKPDPVTGVRSLRMCVSYVKLNAKTLNRIAYRLPRVSTLLDKMSNAAYFSKLDCTSGYYQVPVREQDQHKTAFVTPFGNFEFKVMPFGLCGAPSTFAYLMDQVFKEGAELTSGAKVSFDSFVAVYLDDILIFSKTEEEHFMHISAVLQRLRKWKLYVKPSKCEWLRSSISFLGHTLSAQGRRVDHQRAEALQAWPEPTNASELRTLLGTFGFWRGYIRRFAEITAPLTPLTAKHVPWMWGKEQSDALQHLKRAVLESPVLMHVDQDKQFFVVTDASDFAVSASLEQLNEQGNRQPVAFFSHRLNDAQRKYKVHERELLAIVLALRTWRHYLLNADFKVLCHSDHRPLQHFMTQQTLSGMQMRWQTFLAEFNLEISYVPGKDNVFADGLSRRPDLRLMLVGALAPYDPWLSRIAAGFAHDAVARKLRSQATGPMRDRSYHTINDVLYYNSGGSLRVYVPAAPGLRDDILREFHCTSIAGHYGAPKVMAAVQQWYFWPNMSADVTRFVQACPVCQLKKSTPQPRVHVYPLPVPSKPFTHITLDWVLVQPSAGRKNKHDSLLNVIDRFTKYAIVIPCSKASGTHVMCEALWKEVFAVYGLPESITGDRDTRLTAKEMRALCRFLTVQMKLSVAYHPQTDGQSEVFHRVFLSTLRCFCDDNSKNWADLLPALRYAYNNTVHSATGYTPFKLLHGWTPRDIRAPLAALPPDGYGDVDNWLAKRQRELKAAQVPLERARAAMVAAQKASSRAHVYKVGDKVKVSTRVLPLRDATLARKLQQRWIGPLEVVEVVTPGAYRLEMPNHYDLVHDVFSAHDIRPWLDYETHCHDPDAPELPDVQAHPSLNEVLQVVNRRRCGPAPSGCEPTDIPAQYCCILRDGRVEWRPGTHLNTPAERLLVEGFETEYPRSADRPCEPTSAYADAELQVDYDSPDEVEL